MHLKAAKKLCSSTKGHDDARNQQDVIPEVKPAPLTALENKEQDERQRRDFAPEKPVKNSREMKIESE